jgi:hypothetical protein
LTIPKHFHTYFPHIENLWLLLNQLNKINKTLFNLH